MAKSKKKTATKQAPELGKANYGANEKPRCCPKCKSVDSRAYGHKEFFNPYRKIRYRICGGCGRKFTTTDSDSTA